MVVKDIFSNVKRYRAELIAILGNSHLSRKHSQNGCQMIIVYSGYEIAALAVKCDTV